MGTLSAAAAAAEYKHADHHRLEVGRLTVLHEGASEKFVHIHQIRKALLIRFLTDRLHALCVLHRRSRRPRRPRMPLQALDHEGVGYLRVAVVQGDRCRPLTGTAQSDVVGIRLLHLRRIFIPIITDSLNTLTTRWHNLYNIYTVAAWSIEYHIQGPVVTYVVYSLYSEY